MPRELPAPRTPSAHSPPRRGRLTPLPPPRLRHSPLTPFRPPRPRASTPALHTITLAVFLLLVQLACKPPAPCGPPGAPRRVQLLAAASDAPNIDDDGAPWPVNLRIYELDRGPALESLDFTALLTDAKSVLGDSLLAAHEQTAFPDQRYRWTLELAPDTAQLLVAGLFRRPLGDVWYLLHAAPPGDAATCRDPCLFLALDRGELSGGRFPPAGFPIDAFATACAPVVPPRPGASR